MQINRIAILCYKLFNISNQLDLVYIKHRDTEAQRHKVP